MTPPAAAPAAEIELKLTLPGIDPAQAARQLAALDVLAALPVTQQRLHNRYFDTPRQILRQHQAALRLRSLKQGQARARWLQTFKTAGSAAGALSQRGEWEVAVRGGHLNADALQATPWAGLDADGSLFAQLTPCFETESLRTLRLLPAADGSLIELVLDVGTVRADGQELPLCELELELLKGQPDTLFALAEQIATGLPVLPAPLSKAERGWRLLDGTTDAPRRARRLALSHAQPVLSAAQEVLAEMLGQCLENLDGVLRSDGPELVHQARVGWRRWRSALWLFKPLLTTHPLPDPAPLRPLLQALGAVRDLDVAALDTLPPWADAYIAHDAARAAAWQAMQTALQAERQACRNALRAALQAPATGLALLRLERWLHALPHAAWTSEAATATLGDWAATRTRRLHDRLTRSVKALEQADVRTPEGLAQQHAVRLLAKRTRYVLQALNPVLPRARTGRWHQQAIELQTRIGAARDLLRVAELLAPLGIDHGVTGFLRGVAAARPLNG